jgi:CBS domain-containing protein
MRAAANYARGLGSGPDAGAAAQDEASRTTYSEEVVMTPATQPRDHVAPTMRTTRVGKVMHEGVLTCGRDESLATVARLMADHRVHSIVVTDEPSRAPSLWGVVSDLDLVAAASVRELEEQVAGAAAATPALMIAPGDTLHRAAQLMVEHALTHLVVVERGRPVGVISTLDVADALAGRA